MMIFNIVYSDVICGIQCEPGKNKFYIVEKNDCSKWWEHWEIFNSVILDIKQ